MKKCLMKCINTSSVLYLLIAIRTCGETTDFKLLESEYRPITGLILRPTPNCFGVAEELGDGKFSKVFKASDKGPEPIVFALNVILHIVSHRHAHLLILFLKQ